MRTVRTKVYKFNELSESAKETVIKNERNSNRDVQFYYDEIIESVKEVIELFNLKVGREYTDIRSSHIDDNILELKGVRLYKYIMNNYYDKLFTPKYLKCGGVTEVKKPFHRMRKQVLIDNNCPNKGKYSVSYYSNTQKDNCCVLTGVCYDNYILAPIYDFLKKIDTTEDFEGLINSIESAIQKTFHDMEEYLYSEEFIIGEIETNEFEYTKEGTRF